MNYCAKCSKIIRSIKHCKNCRKQFCSETCLRHHIYTYHFNEQHKKQSNDIKSNENKIIKSEQLNQDTNINNERGLKITNINVVNKKSNTQVQKKKDK